MQNERSIATRVEATVAPVLAHDGFELVLAEYVVRSKILRLYIDHPAGVTLDACSEVARRVGDLLDAEGLVDGPGGIDGKYTLEVSSPGLDRPLVRPEHFQRFVGQTVQVTTKEPVTDNGRRKLVGLLWQADAAHIGIEVQGQRVALAYDDIVRARLVPQF